MEEPRETRPGNTESTSPGILCAGNERAAKPGTKRSKTPGNPSATTPEPPKTSSTPRYILIFTSHRYWLYKLFYVGFIK